MHLHFAPSHGGKVSGQGMQGKLSELEELGPEPSGWPHSLE